MALEKKEIDNFLPNGFETLNQEGYKENFSDNMIQIGYEKDIPDIVSGPNLNNLIDKVGKNFNVLDGIVKFFNNMPMGSLPTVNNKNQLDYVNNNFLNKTQITNCILSAPNGVATYSGSNITVKQGLKVLIPNGRNADGSLKNIEYTLDKDLTIANDVTTNRTVFLSNTPQSLWTDGQFTIIYSVFEQETQPDNPVYFSAWYKPSKNKWYFWAVETPTWTEIIMLPIAKYTTDGTTTVKSLTPYQPVELAKEQDLSLYAKISSPTFTGTPKAPTPSTTTDNTQIATTAFVKDVLATSGAGLATIRKAINGYIKFNNGLIIQWGKVETNGRKKITFPISFTQSNPVVQLEHGYSDITTSFNYFSILSGAPTASSFYIYSNNLTSNYWVAVGY